MFDMAGAPEPRTWSEAHRYSNTIDIVPVLRPDNESLPPGDVQGEFFVFQVETEQEGPMDNELFAEKLWGITSDLLPADGPGFKLFSRALTTGLHGIDMEPMVYPDLNDNMVELLKAFGTRVDAMIIWSTGDVQPTAYQPIKIESSGIISSMRRALHHDDLREERAAIVSKLSRGYIVAGNKKAPFDAYVEQALEAQDIGAESDPVIIAVVEDSVKGLTRIQEKYKEQIGSGSLKFVPIWFTGSREGERARKTETLGQIAEENGFIAISSWSQALEGPLSDKLKQELEHAHLFIDFDGVVANNIEMRVEQARVIFNAMIDGMEAESSLAGLSREGLGSIIIERVRERIQTREAQAQTTTN